MKHNIKKTDAAVYAAAIPESTMLDIASVCKEAAWAERHKNDQLPADATAYERLHATPLVYWAENGHMWAAQHVTTVTQYQIYTRTLCWKDGRPCSINQIKKSLKRIRAAHVARQAAEDLERALATADDPGCECPFYWDNCTDPEDLDIVPWPFDGPVLDDIDPWPEWREEIQARWEREDAAEMPREGGDE